MKQSLNRQITQFPGKGLGAIVMAAGLGKRMKSKLAKVLHPVAGRPMVLYAVELADRLTGAGVAVVVGYQGAQVKAVIDEYWASRSGLAGMRGTAARERGVTAHVKNRAPQPPSILIAEQKEQLGTGHAVMQARAAFARARGGPASTYVILNGDTPLLTNTTVRGLLRLHETERAAVTVLTAVLDDPSGYGRVVRDDEDRRVLRIVEDRDATPAEARLHEVNVGTYVVDGSFLFEALDKLQPQNEQKEYYLTDIVGLAMERGLRVSAMVARDADECLGINTRQQLAAAEKVVRRQICDRWMEAGVTLHDPATTCLDADVEIGKDTVLYPHVTLEGKTRIGEDCVIRSHSRITDSLLGHRVVVQDSCVIREARLEDDSTVGPFAHLRPGTVLRRAAKVGNFVEMKKTDLGEGSKANHLSYLGDARIGRGVNIGAGTITCNYDGVRKHETVIEDEVFVGSDSQLVAPVTVGRGAVVAAGSTITNDVPADALAVARSRQVNRPGWAARRRALPAGTRYEVRGTRQEANPRAPRPAPRALAVSGRAKKKGKK
ncbi:MAG: bifunctional UDP-N-acetylglucosamine diphosphorylase/glucosamine-1-phosphate N-acetyltransferase GlmU [Nitrospirae bacterium]|nr:bifunctional UDP-N-acetylglucosamine diphosphorylase/glucosamine-1-phosphate N-acetyltransferase GlmU [Nitrospirota bacterium]